MKVINNEDAEKFTAYCLLLNRRRQYKIETIICICWGGLPPPQIPPREPLRGYGYGLGVYARTDTQRTDGPIFMIFGRTELRIVVSRSKNCKDSFFEVRFAIGTPKPSKNAEQTRFADRTFRKKQIGSRKMKCRESSETRFGEV